MNAFFCWVLLTIGNTLGAAIFPQLEWIDAAQASFFQGTALLIYRIFWELQP